MFNLFKKKETTTKASTEYKVSFNHGFIAITTENETCGFYAISALVERDMDSEVQYSNNKLEIRCYNEWFIFDKDANGQDIMKEIIQYIEGLKAHNKVVAADSLNKLFKKAEAMVNHIRPHLPINWVVTCGDNDDEWEFDNPDILFINPSELRSDMVIRANALDDGCRFYRIYFDNENSFQAVIIVKELTATLVWLHNEINKLKEKEKDDHT